MKKKIGLILATLVLVMSVIAIPVAASENESVGVSVGVYDSVMQLENKVVSETTPWQIIDDEIGGTLGYNAVGSTFVFGIEAFGLSDGNYSLIYYADYSGDRFGEWGGDNPGAVIGAFDSVGGVLTGSGDVELNMDLPEPPDANQWEHDYTVSDGYAHAHGAKIWLVPTSSLTSGLMPLQAWPPTNDWLFETDLIWYDDTDIDNTIVSISVDTSDINFGIAQPGDIVNGGNIVVTNDGNCPVTVEASVTGGGVFDYLKLNSADVSSYTASLFIGAKDTISVTLEIPSSYVPQGAETGSLNFEAYVQ